MTPLQPLYFLLLGAPETIEEQARAIRAWETRTKRTMPRVLAEIHSTALAIPLAQSEGERTLWNEGKRGTKIAGRIVNDEWIVSLVELWSEFCEGPLKTLEQTFEALESSSSTSIHLASDVMNVWRSIADLDGSGDPPVRDHGKNEVTAPRPLSEWFFRVISDAYTTQDMVPYSFWGPNADLERSEELAPIQPFREGHWLRAVANPLSSDVERKMEADFEHETSSRAQGIVHTFSSASARVGVASDGESAQWWICAPDEASLIDAARTVMQAARLSLVADTPSGEAALRAFDC